MNFPHLHLLLNHFPIIGTMIGTSLFLVSFFRNSDDLRRGSYIIFSVVAVLTIPSFLTGFGAQELLRANPEVSQSMVLRHESAAMLSLWFVEITGILAMMGLWQSYRRTSPSRWNVSLVFVFSLLATVLIARTGNTGGDIRHSEIRPGQETTITEGTFGFIVHIIEPSPEKFAAAMVDNKWWWAFMMDLHFIGLALIIGTVGLLDLRIMGFVKQIPLKPLHRLVPWAMVGLGINTLTGVLAFIGMPLYYTFDVAFWLKMVALLLLGLNAVAFYMTGIFDQVEHVGTGEDAPISAKLLAASSLILWFAVIALGRYIQVLQGSISSKPN